MHHITKLFIHGDADHDHLLRSVPKIPCTKNYHYYYHFIKIPLRVSQGTVATFTAVLDKVIIAYFLFSEFYIPKLIKICSFLTELLKIKIPSLFLKHGVVS